MPSQRFAGKRALVTGGSRGIGLAIVERLAAEGAHVVIADLDDTEAKAAAKAVGNAEALRLDVAEKSMFDDAARSVGSLDIVVANAGICTPTAWDSVTPEQFQNTLDINVTGVWNTVMVGAPHLVARGGGSVIITSSAAGLKVQPFMVHYTTSKFAVRGMAKAFATELAVVSIDATNRRKSIPTAPSPMGLPSGSAVAIAVTRSSAGRARRLRMSSAK